MCCVRSGVRGVVYSFKPETAEAERLRGGMLQMSKITIYAFLSAAWGFHFRHKRLEPFPGWSRTLPALQWRVRRLTLRISKPARFVLRPAMPRGDISLVHYRLKARHRRLDLILSDLQFSGITLNVWGQSVVGFSLPVGQAQQSWCFD